MARVQDQSAIGALQQDPVTAALMQQVAQSGGTNFMRGAIGRKDNTPQYQLAQAARQSGTLKQGEFLSGGDGGDFLVSKGLPGWKAALAPLAGAGAAFALPALAGLGGAAGGASAAVGGGAAASGGGGMGLGSILGALGGGGKLGAALGAVGNIAGSVAKGRADGRAQEADYGLRRDQVAGQNAAANVNADSTRLRQAMLLSLLGGVQDVNITPPAHIADRMASVTGGMRPSAIQGKQEIVDTMRPRIMQALLSGQHMPGLTPTPQAGFLDKLLGGIGTAGAFAGALSMPGAGGMKAPTQPQAPVASPGLIPGSGASFYPDQKLGVIR
jgi:hypothetical protein